MREFVIVSDTSCDLSKEVIKDFNINIIKSHYKGKDGVDRFAFIDWNECEEFKSKADFDKALKASPDKFSTSAPTPEEIYKYFTEFVKEGKDILVVSISLKISSAYNFYLKAKEKIEEEYPDSKIYVINTSRYGAGIGLVAINASIMRDKGMSIDEVYNNLSKNINKYHQMGWVDDLNFVAKKGRITHAKAFIGQLIGIKALGEFNEVGLTSVVGKAVGEAKAFNAMIKYIEKEIVNPEEQVILILHSSREKQALKYKELIEEKFHPKKIYLSEIGVMSGINVGPGLISAYFIGKEISSDLSKETKLMEEILQA